MQRRFTSALLALVCLVLAAAGSNAQADEPAAGRELARILCARCHLNEGQGEKLVPSEIPGFRAIANRTDASLERIVAWLKSLPAVMPDHRLTQDEMDSLADFILSLRDRP